MGRTLSIVCFLMFVAQAQAQGAMPMLEEGGEGHGRAAVNYGMGVTETICDANPDTDGWPTIMCKQLGYPEAHEAKPISETPLEPGTTNSTFSTPINCGDYIHSCSEGATCDHSDDVFIRCKHDVRLEGGPTLNEGRVEWYKNGEFFSVCDETLSSDDYWPRLVCQTLGYNGDFEVSYTTDFGSSSTSYNFDSCQTESSRLKNCPNRAVCNGHQYDVNLKCLDVVKTDINILMLFDVSGSMTPILTPDNEQHFLPQQTYFLQNFFDFTTTEGHFAKYNVNLRAIPFNDQLYVAEQWLLNYGQYSSASELRATEDIGLDVFKIGIETRLPDGKTDIGKVFDEVRNLNVDSSTLVIIISDFVNMYHTPDPVAELQWFKNNHVNVIPVLLNSPHRNEDLFEAVREATKGNLGFDVVNAINEEDFDLMFEVAFGSE